MPAHGWPFLIARGHHAGYRTLLAPAPLLADGDHTVLADHLEPAAVPGRLAVTDLTTPTGRRITVVHTTHPVSGADLGHTTAPRDEHGRPLHLLYGFVCPRAVTPDEADLRTALTTALATYQTFLDNENGFATQAAKPFPLRSTLQMPQPRRITAPVAVALLVVLLAALWWVSLPDEPAPPRPVPTMTPPTGPCATRDAEPAAPNFHPLRADPPQADRVDFGPERLT
ncbi:hypothetical protein GCM10009733_060950 [Nonomuraea maheshkhaliensis]|uniref:Uncharacterized protein n=1 Tax=Nonomuraea maheshkhaliensis TaxID=419590 RepID=A0ABN2FNV0_9ACTN